MQEDIVMKDETFDKEQYIIDAFKSKYKVNPGLKEEQLLLIEKVFACSLPKQLREFLKICNPECIENWDNLNEEEIRQKMLGFLSRIINGVVFDVYMNGYWNESLYGPMPENIEERIQIISDYFNTGKNVPLLFQIHQHRAIHL